MSRLEGAYNIMPVAVQNLMVSVRGLANEPSRYGREYREHRAFLEEFDCWPLEEKLRYQNEELVRFLDYAIHHSPFYRELYSDVDTRAIRSVDDLAHLPVVDKEMLRSNASRLATVPVRGSLEWHTGGTTGKSLVVRATPEDMMRRMAMLDHFKARVGFEHRQMRRATFNGKHIVPPQRPRAPFWRYNAACKQLVLSPFHLTEENMGAYVDALNEFRPLSIDGFFSCICDVASFIERHGRKLSFRPIAIFPTSETLTEEGRSLIERAFGCRVYDQYASSEGAPFVTECSHGSMHVEHSSGVFERLNGDDEVLVTSFTTHGTPLIRYRIGDRMSFSELTTCECGVESIRVERIEGRRLDFLYRADGLKITAAYLNNLFKSIPNAIIRSQFVQEHLGEVTMLIEVDSALYKPEYNSLLEVEFDRLFGPDTRLQIVRVEEILRERSGKFRLVRNYLAESRQMEQSEAGSAVSM